MSDDFKYTSVYLVDNEYVVADNMTSAIELYMKANSTDEPKEVKILRDYDNPKESAYVLIKIKENETKD